MIQKPIILLVLLAFSGTPLVAAPHRAEPSKVENQIPEDLKRAQITERLGESVDIQNLTFTDENGQSQKLSNYFHAGRPVIVTMVYYTCPGLCNYLLNGFTNSIRTLGWTVGKEFEVVSVSINPKEGPDMAKPKKANYIKEYGRLEADAGWHFLTGKEPQIQKLAQQLGFGYFFDPAAKEFAHSAGIFVLTPAGKISRVLYGIDYPNRDLKLSLLEASEGKVGTAFDRFLMFCYHYDPSARGYAFQAMKLVQVGSALMILLLAVWVGTYWWKQRKSMGGKNSSSDFRKTGSDS